MSSMFKWTDPFDDMSDEEFDEHVDRLFAQRPHTVGISLRVQADLLERVKRQAKRAGVPYQTFMKSVLEAAVARLERRESTPDNTGHTARAGAIRKGRTHSASSQTPRR